jgi:hypothetical protein
MVKDPLTYFEEEVSVVGHLGQSQDPKVGVFVPAAFGCGQSVGCWCLLKTTIG